MIHASKNIDLKAMKRFGFSTLPIGVIIGEAEILDVKRYNNYSEHKKDKNKHLANSLWRKYGFILKNAKRIKPIEAKGKLCFLDFNF